MKTHWTYALLGLLCLTVFESAECLQTVVRADTGVKVMVSPTLTVDQCEICTVNGVNDTQMQCQSSVTVNPEEEVQLLFKCPQPLEQAYVVDIFQTIVCTKEACSPATGAAPQSILPNFTRGLHWGLEAPEKTVVRLEIHGNGLMETTQPCTDGLQFSASNADSDETQYCRGGSVTHLDLLNGASIVVRVNPDVQVESVFQAAPLKGRTMVVSVDSSTTVVIRRNQADPECEVCSAGSVRTCSQTELTLTDVDKLSLEFSCTNPQDVFTADIKRRIACTQTSCSPASGDVDPDLLKDFNRHLTWAVASPERTVLTLDFPDQGLKEISGAEKCQDGYQYSVSSGRSDRKVTKSYCKGGSVSTLDLSGVIDVTLEVPKGGELDPTAFTVKAALRASRMISVTTDPDTKITIKREDDDSDCNACVNEGADQTCDKKQLLRDPRNISVEFTCPQPQDVFIVEINRDLDCSKVSCSGDVLPSEYSLFPDFNRSFSWDFKVGTTQAFQLDFPEPGMQQIPDGETCPDDHTYSIISYLRSGPTDMGTFCKGGPVSSIQVRYKGRIILKVPANTKVDPVSSPFSEGPQTDLLAVVKVHLPRGVSDTRLTSPNYPQSFPDNEVMQWDFIVPSMHNYTMHFNDHMAPECLQKEVMVEYYKEGKRVAQRSLTDPQPMHQQGNFNMMLKNCITNTSLQGLGLDFKVSVMRSGHPVLCTVDLTKHQAVSVQIEKVGSDPYCEMSVNSKLEKKINMAAGTKTSLSFLDCPNEDVRLTASEVIECWNVSSCPGTLLTVPKLASCLPMPLHSFTWNLNFPQDATADLVSPTGSLRQSVPGQECAQSVLLHVAEADGFNIGDFCFNGAIQKVQVHTNVSITAHTPNFSRTRGHFLNVSFSPEIPETVIYRVTPDVSSPTLLATPNWPKGMKASSTVSWIVTVPNQYQALMQFVNVSQPKCNDRHTAMKVKMLGYEEEMMSRREDETPEDKLIVPYSFYLNMSNCIPEEGDFGAVTKINLQKKSNLLAILLGIAGALLLLLIVLAVVCVITKKKKKDQMNKESSIYIGKGNIFRPNDRTFTKARSDNESHVYASIDEMMVYGHLLGDSSYTDSVQDNYKGLQVDSYNTFTGPTDPGMPAIKEPDSEPEMDQYRSFLDPSETFIPSRPRTPIDRQDSLGFQDRRMVDNELYTFKNTGEINTIRLSGIDMEPQPPITEESL
ncbi:CUB domain-containing protein 1 [Sphaeramia orbicularis]|uniref:CUB domain-containing protein 1-like n=1 Tax=Sphaeramia orbicularis TaxID=375764 RepID=A0A673B066_9TELE|nr:CUB domain-containing protein 1-like [Sphaeramia orbicularis]